MSDHTHEQIEQWAREAGLHLPCWGDDEDPKTAAPRWTMVSPTVPPLSRFAAIVAAAERERTLEEASASRSGPEKKQRRKRTLEDRFWEKVDKTPISGCWEWTSSRRGNGYGAFFTNDAGGVRRCHGAHRMSWELSRGPIPAGMFVLHRCDNRLCVNPEHLFLGSAKDNMVDCANKGRIMTVGKSRLTHCQHGHEFTAENTRITSRGHRRCRTCDRAHSLNNRKKNGAIWNAARRERYAAAIRARGAQGEAHADQA